MDLRITFDISDKLNDALGRIAIAIEAIRVRTASPVHSEAVECPAKGAEIAPVAQVEPEQAITQPEPEIVKTEPVLVQNAPIREPAANDNTEEPQKADPEPVKKPAKKKAVKKAEIAPETHEETAQAVTQPEPEIVKPEPILEQPEPKKEAQPPADDGMGGMNLMEASQQLIKDIQDAGVEMADANARVRAKANELGLNYGSITCLIKAIGYVEARKAAIGK